ncbi:MAG: TGS domain-containing protein [Peptococcaceae bacterium]|nr:TGS domain-containing protein [Peptococcaceae bacterium]
MPANLTPQYHAAEENFKKAATTEEKIAALEEMLAVIPKHKGTEKLQADIKKRLSKLKDETAKKGAAKRFDPFHIEKQGAGQVVLFGFPNTGKSSILNVLTRANAKVADYPFTTTLPVNGMMPFEDILIQLVDLPPITADMSPPGISGALINSDIIMVVFDASSDDCLDQVNESMNFLYKKRILREEKIPGVRSVPPDRVILVGNKIDRPQSTENMDIVRELKPGGFKLYTVSATTGENTEELKTVLFKTLDIIRVYSKVPGKEPDLKMPFVLKQGSTVLDLAEKIHKELAQKLKFARVWGSAKFEGQSVPKDYPLRDRDIVEVNI